MDYILFYKGKIPKYLNKCVNSILSVDSGSNVYFLTDQKITSSIENFKIVDINTLKGNSSSKITDLDYFKGDNNPLWETSLIRLFYIYDFVQSYDIKSFVHFDADVLIYKPFQDLVHLMATDKINITPLTSDFLVFGYSYFPNPALLSILINKFYDILKDSKSYENRYYEGKRLNEMKMLHIANIEIPSLFNLLNVLPISNSNLVFDPGSYGQYIGGTHNKKFSKKFIDLNHLVGMEIHLDKIKPKKVNTNFIIKNESNFDKELVNLHVHSKNLKKYLPSEYIEKVRNLK